MTTIIGLQNDHGCVIAADSQTTTSDGMPWQHADLSKIVNRGAYLIAASGVNQSCDIALNIWQPPPRPPKQSWYQFAITELVPSLRACHASNWFEPTPDDEWSLMIASRGELLTIESDYSVLRSKSGMYGLGSGSPYALGALAVLLASSVGETSVKRAIEIASAFDIYTASQVSIITQPKGG
jgi:ATP-dependent protease HslVU (ClpYQ) peptidase subunit